MDSGTRLPVKLALLGAVLLLSIGCGSQTLHGTVHLTSSSGVTHAAGSCSGSGGYDDLTAGAPVTVKNESGSIIATGTLDEGVSDPAYPTVACDFAFTISNLPDAKFYSVEVSHRGALTYSKDELNAKGWKIAATIGS